MNGVGETLTFDTYTDIDRLLLVSTCTCTCTCVCNNSYTALATSLNKSNIAIIVFMLDRKVFSD